MRRPSRIRALFRFILGNRQPPQARQRPQRIVKTLGVLVAAASSRSQAVHAGGQLQVHRARLNRCDDLVDVGHIAGQVEGKSCHAAAVRRPEYRLRGHLLELIGEAGGRAVAFAFVIDQRPQRRCRTHADDAWGSPAEPLGARRPPGCSPCSRSASQPGISMRGSASSANLPRPSTTLCFPSEISSSSHKSWRRTCKPICLGKSSISGTGRLARCFW